MTFDVQAEDVARVQARLCIAALTGASGADLADLRERLGQAVTAINKAPNEATARALFQSPRVQEALWAWAAAEASMFIRNLTRTVPPDADKLSDLASVAVIVDLTVISISTEDCCEFGLILHGGDRDCHDLYSDGSCAAVGEPQHDARQRCRTTTFCRQHNLDNAEAYLPMRFGADTLP